MTHHPTRRALTAALICALPLAMTACGGGSRPHPTAPDQPVTRRTNFTPPGPPNDPWGPYIVQAERRFDIPGRWIRAVMDAESGARTHLNGRPITSPAGAMGLMQIMPGTWAELTAKYDLGTDPHDPLMNIMGGTAYLREMYDRFDTPGFLAAYNAGPGRYGQYLTQGRPLPRETLNYLRKINPRIAGVYPRSGPTRLITDLPVAADTYFGGV